MSREYTLNMRRIKKLERLIADPAATEGEITSAKRILAKLRQRLPAPPDIGFNLQVR